MEINEYLLKFFQTVKDMESIDLFDEQTRLTQTEFRVIREIILEQEKGSPIIGAALARRLGVSRSAVSQIVYKLEDRDILKRIPSEIDHKTSYICLSDRCLQLFEEQCKHAGRIMDRAIKEVGRDKVKQFFKTYDEFSAALKRIRREIDD